MLELLRLKRAIRVLGAYHDLAYLLPQSWACSVYDVGSSSGGRFQGVLFLRRRMLPERLIQGGYAKRPTQHRT
jgi:hypothetical protein